MPDRSLTVRLRAEVAQFKAQIGSAAASLNGMAAKVTAANAESKKFREGLTTLGSGAGKVGLVAAAGLGYAIKSAADFNAEMALVKTLSHASASDMDKLSQAALTVGQNIGYSAKSVAAGEEEMIKAGVSVKDILGGGLKGALDLAAAGQTDVATATQIAAAALTEFQLKGKDVPHVADLLAAGADKALGSVEDLGYGLSQAGTTADQMGISIEQTVGTLAAFAQAGLLGEKGGTTFKMMLLRLSNPSAQAQKAMDRLGISLYDANGQIKTMPELADNLSRSLANLTPKQRAAALGTIFGARAIQGANILIAEGSKGIQDWITKVNDQGFAAQQASGKLDSLSGDVKKLGAALQTAFIGVGSGDQGPLREMVQDATSAVNAFNQMPGPIKGVASDMLLITAITGGGLWFGSKVIRGVSDTRAALGALGVTADGTRSKLRGIGGFMAGPWGVALTVGAVALGKYAAGQAETRARVQSLSESLDAQTGAITANTRSLMAQTLEGQGVLAAAKELGLGLDVVTDAALGNSEAMATVKGRITEIQTGLKAMGTTSAGDDPGLTKLGDAMGKVTGAIGDGNKEITAAREKTLRLAEASGAAADGTTKLADAQAGATGAVTGLTEDQEALAKALEESRKAANDTAHQFFGLGNSVNDSKVSLHSWITDLQKQAAALRDFTKNAQTAGKRGLKQGLIAELEKAGPAGAMRMKQLADASDAEIKRANRAWRSGQRAIDKYTDVVGGVPDAVATDVHVNGVPGAVSAVRALKLLMDSLHDRNIHINVTKTTNAALAEADANSGGKKHAIGGLVTGPGTGTSDDVPAYLSNGEFVVRAAAVKKYGVHMFEGLNAMRYAGGGLVGAHHPGGGGGGNETPKHELQRFKVALDRSTKAIDKETGKRDDLVQAQDQLKSSISSSLTSDLFKDRGAFSPQGGIVSGALDTLRGDLTRAQAFNGLEGQLSARGLHGDALRALEEQANGDPGILAAFANASSSDVSAFQDLFAQRASAVSAAGTTAGSTYNAQIAQSNKHLAQLVAENKVLSRKVDKLEKAIKDSAHHTGDQVGKQVNGAAAAGHRRKARR